MTVAAALVSAAMLGVGGLWLLIAFTRAIAHAFGWSEAIVYAGVGALLAVGGVALAVAVAYRVKGIRVLPRTRDVLAANGHWRSRRTADGPDARW
jgi:hypothetical protein